MKENLGGDPQLFYAEANILAALHHPNLPRVSDHFIEAPPTAAQPGAQYLVMDYIAGQTLEEVVQARRMLTEQDALAWMFQVMDAVRYLHTNRIIHRDIKPQNIIITPDGRAVLVDFGIAKVMQPGRATVTGARGFGSPGYASPEQYTGGTDERSDVYSLGATMYFALTGVEPPSVPQRAGGVALVSIRQRNTSVSAKTESAIVKAMELRKDQRFQNIPEIEFSLRAPLVAPTPRAPAAPNQLLVGIGIVVIALVLISLTAVGAIVLRGGVSATTAATIVVAVAGATGTRAPSVTTPAPILPTATPIIVVVTATPVPPTATPTATVTPRYTATPTPRLGEERMIGGAPMVLVPAGEFTMGSNDASDEKSPHEVYLDSFWIDKFEVTNALYKKCVDTGRCRPPSLTTSWTRDSYYGNSQYDNYPVIYVSWNDANAFCAWPGKRLPTEAEWEKAARGTDKRIYPSGNTFDENLLNNNAGGKGDTTVVGNFPAGVSPYGALDMAGNVWEWVADWYDSSYYTNSPLNNPKGPSSGQARVLRGGSWYDHVARAPSRFNLIPDPDNRYGFVGLRCAQ